MATIVFRRSQRNMELSMRVAIRVFTFGLMVTLAASAQADVFNMGGTISGGTWTGLASLSFVTVGDPGNVADPVDRRHR